MLHDSRTAPRACSYPYTPDCLALCTWVAAEDGDAAALSMVATEAQSKQAAAAAARTTANSSTANDVSMTVMASPPLTRRRSSQNPVERTRATASTLMH